MNSSATGIFALADTVKRQLPTAWNPVTHETIHSSVLKQDAILPHLKEILDKHPELVALLMPLEEELKVNWHFNADSVKTDSTTKKKKGNKTVKVADTPTLSRNKSLLARTRDAIMRRTRSDSSATQAPPTVSKLARRDSSKPGELQNGLLSKISDETNFGALVRQIVVGD